MPNFLLPGTQVMQLGSGSYRMRWIEKRSINGWYSGWYSCGYILEPVHPPGTQLLLWDDIDDPAESLQEAKSAKENRYRQAYGGNII